MGNRVDTVVEPDEHNAVPHIGHSAGIFALQDAFILVVMSDGHPNGDRKVWEETTERIRELGTARKLSVVAVGIGNDADMEMLAKVSPRQRPVRLNGLQFREFFAWLSRSVANVSASLPGEEPNVDLEALEALSAEPWPENTL